LRSLLSLAERERRIATPRAELLAPVERKSFGREPAKAGLPVGKLPDIALPAGLVIPFVQRHEPAVYVADLKNASRRALARALRLERGEINPQRSHDGLVIAPRVTIEQHPPVAALRDT
jgi:hypothetical protein